MTMNMNELTSFDFNNRSFRNVQLNILKHHSNDKSFEEAFNADTLDVEYKPEGPVMRIMLRGKDFEFMQDWHNPVGSSCMITFLPSSALPTTMCDIRSISQEGPECMILTVENIHLN